VASLGWIGLAIATTFLQDLHRVLLWREVSADAACRSLTRRRAYNLIGCVFNRPCLLDRVATRFGSGWSRALGAAGGRRLFDLVDRAIGLIALAVVIVASLPWSYQLDDQIPTARARLLLVDFARLPAGSAFLIFGRLQWPWLKRCGGRIISMPVRSSPTASSFTSSREARGPKIAVLSAAGSLLPS